MNNNPNITVVTFKWSLSQHTYWQANIKQNEHNIRHTNDEFLSISPQPACEHSSMLIIMCYDGRRQIFFYQKFFAPPNDQVDTAISHSAWLSTWNSSTCLSVQLCSQSFDPSLSISLQRSSMERWKWWIYYWKVGWFEL